MSSAPYLLERVGEEGLETEDVEDVDEQIGGLLEQDATTGTA